MMETVDNLTDAVIFGKIMLDKSTWEISFICTFCERIQTTFPELMRHALSEHSEDVTVVNLENLCGIETKEEVHIEGDVCDMIVKDIMDRQEEEEMDEELIRHFMKKESVIDDEYIKTEIRTTPIEINDSNGSGSDADNDPSNPKSETQNDNPDRIIKVLQCKTCNAQFRRPKQLREHKQKEHGKIGRKTAFVCKECGKVFSCYSSLANHRLRHKGIKPHACTICEKTFITRTEVRLHMRRHTGERPYKCSYCDKDFICSGELTSHTRTHTNERSHLCSICGMKLISAAGLKKHLTTHSSERPHKCSQCNWSSKTKTVCENIC